MPIHLLIAPPAFGKTRFCIRKIQQLKKQNPLAPLWVILPGQAQAEDFRHRLALEGGALNIHIETFGNLCAEILAQAGQPVGVLPGQALFALAKSVVNRLAQKKALGKYAPLAGFPGFIQELQARFAELERALSEPERIAAAGLPDLARLYAAYRQTVEDLGSVPAWDDREGQALRAVNLLDSSLSQAGPGRRPFLGGCPLLVVDGFDTFSPAQRRLLAQLGRLLPEVLVTLPGLQDMDRAGPGRQAHRRFALELADLRRDLDLEILTLPPPPDLPAPLRQIEAGLFVQDAAPCSRCENQVERVVMLEVRSPAGEAREALRWLKARILRDSLKPGDCAVILPDPDLYFPSIRAAAKEFDLPLRLFQKISLASTAETIALLRLLKLPLQNSLGLNFLPRDLLQIFRSPHSSLIEFDLSREDAAGLEAVCRYGRVTGGQDQWDEILAYLEADETQRTKPVIHLQREPGRLPDQRDAARLHAGLLKFFNRLAPPEGKRPLIEWIDWLGALLDEIHFLDSAQASEAGAARLNQAWDEIHACLREWIAGEIIAGPNLLDYRGFVNELERSIKKAHTAPEGQSRDGIWAISVLDARGLRFAAAAVLGLAEGVFPQAEQPDPFIPQEARDCLGLEPAVGRNQDGLFYLAATRGDRFALFTRPTQAKDGEVWEASPYWSALARLFSEKPGRIAAGSPRHPSQAASSQEALSWKAQAVFGQRWPVGDGWLEQDWQPRWENLEMRRQALQSQAANRKSANSGSFSGNLAAAAAEFAARYGQTHTWSPSRLEKYGECPFRFLLESVFGLDRSDLPEIGPEPFQLGGLLHSLLKEAFADHARGGLEAVHARLDNLARQVFPNAPQEYGFRPGPDWDLRCAELLEGLHKTVDELSKPDKKARWIPYRFEVPFGAKDRRGVPAQDVLKLKIEGETILISGIIDRIDCSSEDENLLRIIDYKTGSSHLGKADLALGRRLQLPLYALAARDALQLGNPAEGMYFVLTSNKPSGLRLSSYLGRKASPVESLEAAIAEALLHIQRIIAGVRAGEFPSRPVGNACPEYCAAAGWCWRFHPEK